MTTDAKQLDQSSEPQSEVLFSIRPVRSDDLPYIRMMCDQAQMPLPKDYLAGTIAVNDKDQPVGFIRILEVREDENPQGLGAYIYPVVVFENWRHQGVAKALVDYELQRYKTLRLVACRPSRGFYQRSGFEPEEWDNIAAVIAYDCELCPDCSSCDPQPFRKALQ